MKCEKRISKFETNPKRQNENRKRPSRRFGFAGFTLAESLIASVVLAAAVVGIAGALGASYKQTAVSEDSATALDLGRELMEEVAARPFEVSGANAAGWPTVSDRTRYDTIDDFNGYTDTSNAIAMSSGSSVDAGNGSVFTRAVTVQSGTMPTGMTGNTGDFATVTVTVTSPSGEAYTLSQLCTRATVVR